MYITKKKTNIYRTAKNFKKKHDVNAEFLKTIYVQCNVVYTTFVGARFQMLTLLISNAALFHFAYTQELTPPILMIVISLVALTLTWIIFFIDRRNKYIFSRATKIASLIEKYFDIPLEMSLHTKTPQDYKQKLSHTNLFTAMVVLVTIFWVGFCVYFMVFRNSTMI